MNSEVYRKIKREYDIKRQIKLDEARKIKEEIYEKNEHLKQIEDEINMLALKTTRNILNSDEITRQIEEENMKSKLDKLQKKYDTELKNMGLKREDLLPKYDCMLCQDTGVIKKR